MIYNGHLHPAPPQTFHISDSWVHCITLFIKEWNKECSWNIHLDSPPVTWIPKASGISLCCFFFCFGYKHKHLYKPETFILEQTMPCFKGFGWTKAHTGTEVISLIVFLNLLRNRNKTKQNILDDPGTQIECSNIFYNESVESPLVRSFFFIFFNLNSNIALTEKREKSEKSYLHFY